MFLTLYSISNCLDILLSANYENLFAKLYWSIAFCTIKHAERHPC